MPFTVYAQTKEQEYVSRLSDCMRKTMEIDDSFMRITYLFVPADSFKVEGALGDTKVNSGYRDATIRYLDSLGRRADHLVRETITHEHFHTLFAPLRHAVWNMIFDRYLVIGLKPEVAAARTNHMIHQLFHPVLARLERWDVWQQVCSVDDLYR
jgi:hypothetical protein